MAYLEIDGTRLKYKHQNKTEIVLDFQDVKSNYSKIPFYSMDDNQFTIIKLIGQLMSDSIPIWNEKKGQDVDIHLVDICVVKEVIKSRLGRKVLEIGCENGILSYHLATILGSMQNQSSLFCVSDIINPFWVDQLSTVERLPELHYFATEYDAIHLEQEYFDLVVINGNVNFEQPEKTLKEAIRLLKEDGSIICYCNDMPSLESSFHLLFEHNKSYELDGNRVIYVANKQDITCTEEEKVDCTIEIRQHIQALKEQIVSEEAITKEHLKECIRQIEQDVDTVMQEELLDWKNGLLELKEYLLDYMVGFDSEYRSYYRQVVIEYLNIIPESNRR